MNKYHLKLSFKTKILNFFRRLIQISFIESWLVKRLETNSKGIYAKLVPPDYLYKAGSTREAERFGLKYKLDISNVVDHYLYYYVHDTSFNNFIENYVKHGDNVLDIGANIGTTVTRLAAKVGSDGYVIGFEPSPANYKRATGHIHLNKLENCKVENIGLGDKLGSLKLFRVNEHNPGMNRILKSEEVADMYPYDEVQIITLDDYCVKNNIKSLNAIKIDVEGFEYFVLKGGFETLSKWRPVIMMEVNHDFLKEQALTAQHVFDLLKKCGYTQFINADTEEQVDAGNFTDGVHMDIICKD